jgi:Bacteriophage tail sheath protein
MAQVSFPGVYIQEVPSGVRTITGVSTAIALFIGMAKRGQINTPTTVLGFTDFTRAFGDDITQGEMTDQVRQFFLNGGQQAIVVRIANQATSSSLTLNTVSGGTIVLKAKSEGEDGRSIRARVDFNTQSPERTFNLTLFRELIDANGNARIDETEVLKDLSVDSADPRFITTVIAQSSRLVTVDSMSTVTPTNGYSVGGRLVSITGPAPTSFDALVVAAVKATQAGNTGTKGQFKITLPSLGTKTVVVQPATATVSPTQLKGFINDAFGSSTDVVNVEYLTQGDTQYLKITAAGTEDVILDRASELDIGQALGLGVAQGGLEVGAFSTGRPVPSGLVSVVDDTGAATPLLQLADTQKTTLVSVNITGPQAPFPAASAIQFLTTTDRLRTGTVSSVPHLFNVRQNLKAIADAVNAGAPGKWRAEVQGYRLAILPVFGLASDGANHVISTLSTDLSTGGNIFDGVATSGPAASSATGGSDGFPPQAGDYQAAFQKVDEVVDLFNILILPRSAKDAQNIRATIWGDASSFCLDRRAFLLVDASADVKTVDDMLAEILKLRVGLVKDHGAVYWPRVKIARGSLLVPIDPSGSIAGVMSRIDSSRGVWKAPAGIEADVRGVLGLDVLMSDPQNGLLNPQTVNALRSFPNGIVSWGARTVDGFDNSGNDDFKYVPVRRFELFIEESLVRGLKFAVFEPNDEQLWSQIRLAVGAFMNNLFRKGAFAGKTSREAYFVKVDSETTTQNDINLGIVNVVVGFAPLKPAEFIVVTIQQQAGQVQV